MPCPSTQRGLRWPSVIISYSLRNCFAASSKLFSVFSRPARSFPRNVRYQSSATCLASSRLASFVVER